MVKVFFHTPRNCSLIVEHHCLVFISQIDHTYTIITNIINRIRTKARYNSLHSKCVTFSTFLRSGPTSGYAIHHWSGPSSNADLVDLWCSGDPVLLIDWSLYFAIFQGVGISPHAGDYIIGYTFKNTYVNKKNKANWSRNMPRLACATQHET